MGKKEIKKGVNSFLKKEESVLWKDRLKDILSYLGVLSLLVFLWRDKEKPASCHLRQGLVLFGLEIIFTLVMVVPFVGWLIGLLGWILCTLLSLGGILKAAQGKEWSIPVIKKISQQIKI
jgi:uncharacterized membrane protein